jgi:hypothetical protein
MVLPEFAQEAKDYIFDEVARFQTLALFPPFLRYIAKVLKW